MKQKKNVIRKSLLLTKLVLTVALLAGGAMTARAQKSLPYSYGFEDNNLATHGWTSQGLYSLSGIKSTSSYGIVAYAGSYSFRFYNKDSYSNQYLISPELENSNTGIDVSFYYTTNIANYNEQFKIGYSTTTSDVSTAFTWYEETPISDTSWHKYERSFPAGTKYIAILYSYVNDNSRQKIYIDNISIDKSETYKRPKNLTVDSQTTSSATFSWTAGSDETAWQIAYSTKADFSPSTEGIKVDVTETTYALSGLTDGYTYYAYVRSNYSGNYSEWSNMIQFTLSQDYLVNNGETTSSNLPIYGYNVASLTQSQFIIPASDLTNILNRDINKLTFYTKGADYETVNWGNATFEVYLNSVTTNMYNSTTKDYEDWGTKVFNEEKLSVSNNKMEVVFDTPFRYTGGNLMIGVKQIKTGTNKKIEWYAVSKTYGNNYGIYTYGSSTYTSYVVPKVTLTTTSTSTSVTLGSNGYTTFASPRALDLGNLPSGLTAYKAEVDAANSKVRFTEINQAVPANTGILLAGTANTTYSIPVADNGTAVDNNDFFVNSTGGTFTAESGYTYFGLLKNSDPLTFGTFEPGSVAIPTNKAYLKVANGGASRLTCLFYNETEGIQSMERKALTSEVYYNLAGQRVDKPSKGLYIVNGKKVIIK